MRDQTRRAITRLIAGKIALAVLLLAGLAGCAPATEAATSAPVPTAEIGESLTIEAGILTVAIDQEWPPFQYQDDNGQSAGFDVELAHALAQAMGLKAKFVPDTWAAAQAKVREGNADCIFSLTPTEDRSKIFDFSTVYRSDIIAVFVKPGSPARKIEDLYGKKVAAESGGMNWMQMALGTHYDQIRPVKTESLEESLAALQKDQVDGAIVGAREVGLFLAGRMGARFRSVYEVSGVDETVGVKKGNTVLLAQINQALAAIKSDGTFDQIYARWFGDKTAP